MPGLFEEELINKIQASGIIAVLVVDELQDCVTLAKCLLDNGVSAMELTLRTPLALEAVQAITDQVPEMLAGVGTVLTTEQVEQVAKAGAAFAVAPGLNPNVVTKASQLQLPFAPGVATPSDIERAVGLGCKVLKFFPAEVSGGLKYLKSMAAPYNHLGLKYIPLGGLKLDNMRAYLEDPLVLAIGGSWIAPRKSIQAKDWNRIAANAKQAIAMVKEIR